MNTEIRNYIDIIDEAAAKPRLIDPTKNLDETAHMISDLINSSGWRNMDQVQRSLGKYDWSKVIDNPDVLKQLESHKLLKGKLNPSWFRKTIEFFARHPTATAAVVGGAALAGGAAYAYNKLFGDDNEEQSASLPEPTAGGSAETQSDEESMRAMLKRLESKPNPSDKEIDLILKYHEILGN